MASPAEHVYTDKASIRRLESLIDQLPAHGHVVLVMQDGSSCDGVVSARPNVQVFRDAAAQRGDQCPGAAAAPRRAGMAPPDLAGPGAAGRVAGLGHGSGRLSSGQVVGRPRDGDGDRPGAAARASRPNSGRSQRTRRITHSCSTRAASHRAQHDQQRLQHRPQPQRHQLPGEQQQQALVQHVPRIHRLAGIRQPAERAVEPGVAPAQHGADGRSSR